MEEKIVIKEKKSSQIGGSSGNDGPVASAVRGQPLKYGGEQHNNKMKKDTGDSLDWGKSFEIEDFESRKRKRRYAPGVKDHGDTHPAIGRQIPQMMIDHNGRPIPVKDRFTTLEG